MWTKNLDSFQAGLHRAQNQRNLGNRGRAGRRVQLKDGRMGTMSWINKLRSGWEYYIHLDGGGVESVLRTDFKYLKGTK